MKSLKEYIYETKERKKAIGHFNISNIETLWAIFHAVQRVSDEIGEQVPVVIGTSEGERGALGDEQVVALIKSIREEYKYPLFLNADHCHSFEAFKKAIDAGYDSAIIDHADKSLEENISLTKEAVSYARSINAGVLVEGELGYIGQSSALLDSLPEGAQVEGIALTTQEDAVRYVNETTVDFFAPAVGNIHGMLKNAPNPRLDIPRIQEIARAVSVPLVLHGGSGISNEDFVSGIEAGIAMVHINTEIRLVFRDSLKVALVENPNEVSPYKLMDPVQKAMQEVIEKKIRLFWRV